MPWRAASHSSTRRISWLSSTALRTRQTLEQNLAEPAKVVLDINIVEPPSAVCPGAAPRGARRDGRVALELASLAAAA